MSEPTYLEKHCRHFEEDKKHPLNQGCAVTGYVFSGEHPVNNCKHFELKPEITERVIEVLLEAILYAAECEDCPARKEGFCPEGKPGKCTENARKWAYSKVAEGDRKAETLKPEDKPKRPPFTYSSSTA